MFHLIFVRIIMYIIIKFFKYAILLFCFLTVQKGLKTLLIYQLTWFNTVGQLLVIVISWWGKRVATFPTDLYKKILLKFTWQKNNVVLYIHHTWINSLVIKCIGNIEKNPGPKPNSWDSLPICHYNLYCISYVAAFLLTSLISYASQKLT